LRVDTYGPMNRGGVVARTLQHQVFPRHVKDRTHRLGLKSLREKWVSWKGTASAVP